MTDTSFTLLEIHLGDSDVRIGANSLRGGADTADERAEAENGETTDDGSGSGCPLVSAWTALVLVGVLAVAGLVAARLRGGNLEDAEALDALGE